MNLFMKKQFINASHKISLFIVFYEKILTNVFYKIYVNYKWVFF